MTSRRDIPYNCNREANDYCSTKYFQVVPCNWTEKVVKIIKELRGNSKDISLIYIKSYNKKRIKYFDIYIFFFKKFSPIGIRILATLVLDNNI